MQVNPDPQKFDMQIAHGVKNAADVDEMGADAPDIAVPFCKAHGRWPCMDCGTKHFEGCECPYCMVPAVDPLEEVREAAGYAVGIIRGMLPTGRRPASRIRSISWSATRTFSQSFQTVTCSTNKRCYRTHEAARREGRRQMTRQKRVSLRVYRCEECKQWHLTSTPRLMNLREANYQKRLAEPWPPSRW